jgi:TonB family protein
MKRNNIFFSILGLSMVLHGLILFGVAKDGFYTPSPMPENQFVSTLKIIKTGTMSLKNAPNQEQESNVTEKPIEPIPELVPLHETENIEDIPKEDSENNEELQEDADTTEDSGTVTGDTLAEDSQNDKEAQEGGHKAGDSGTVARNDYEELLVYIKEFIDKNLIYPPIARQRNIQGIVGVSLEIEMNGEIAPVSVVHSSGSSILDRAAVSLIKEIRPPENITIRRKVVLNVNIDYKLTE